MNNTANIISAVSQPSSLDFTGVQPVQPEMNNVGKIPFFSFFEAALSENGLSNTTDQESETLLSETPQLLEGEVTNTSEAVAAEVAYAENASVDLSTAEHPTLPELSTNTQLAFLLNDVSNQIVKAKPEIELNNISTEKVEIKPLITDSPLADNLSKSIEKITLTSPRKTKTPKEGVIENIGQAITPTKTINPTAATIVEPISAEIRKDKINTSDRKSDIDIIAESTPELLEHKNIDQNHVIAAPQNVEHGDANATYGTEIDNIQLAQPKLDYVKLVPTKKPIADVIVDTKLTTTSHIEAQYNDFTKTVEPLVRDFEVLNNVSFKDEPLPNNIEVLENSVELKDNEVIQISKPIEQAQQKHDFKISRSLDIEKSIPTQISVNLMKSIENGKSNMTFNLSPANLGEVEIKFQTNKDGQTQITILSEKFTTFDTLSKSINQIESILTQHGFQDENISIDVGLKDYKGRDNQQNKNLQFTEYQTQENSKELTLIKYSPIYNGLLNIEV